MSASPFRAQRQPNRRAVVAVLDRHSENQDYLKAEVDRLSAHVEQHAIAIRTGLLYNAATDAYTCPACERLTVEVAKLREVSDLQSKAGQVLEASLYKLQAVIGRNWRGRLRWLVTGQ